MRLRTPKLDFVVIGAQKAGTTSLWHYLEDNPDLRMPPDKEASFFTEPGYPDELRAYLRALFKDAPAGATLGTVTPVYMVGVPGVPVPVVAERIAATFPDLKMVALLRDPVERARSAHQMLVRRGEETRSFSEAVADLLRPDALEEARRDPVENRSYVTAGEYGRLLTAYLERFPREQLHVELTADLAREPGRVVTRVCRFLGVEPHVPRRLGTWFHTGGRPRVSPEAEADLKEYLDRHVWSRVREAAQHRSSFEHWFRLWNVEPGEAEERPALDDETESRLREHYTVDARVLDEATGLRAPWSR